ncbi:hypothetical protein Tco_0371801 [Tanacetum coccineum]
MVLETENERILRAVVSQDIMSTVQSLFVVKTYDLQTELERTKERFENCIIKKEMNMLNFGMIAQLGDLKGKSMDTQCASDTLDLSSQKLEDENVSLEFYVLIYAKENAHLRTTYKNLFDSINVSEQKDTSKGMSVNTKFANQSTSGTKRYSVTPFPETHFIPKVVETIDLSKPVTSNSVPTTKESKVMKNDKVIAPGMFRINPSKTSREDKFVPINKSRASFRTNPFTISQPHVITKKDVNSDSNGLSSTGVESTAKTRRP